MSIREDSDPYCVLWLGILLLSAYYFNFFYLSVTDAAFLASISVHFLPFMLFPPILVFLFVGYLRPKSGPVKLLPLIGSVVFSLIYVLAALAYYTGLGEWLFQSSWAVGSSLLTAGGFAMMHKRSDSTSPGIMDVKAVEAKYIPVPEEPEEEVVEEATEPVEVAEAEQPATDAPSEETPDSKATAAEE
ncbi:MAG: hypothetical protein ACW968_06735 [Candidatus Thorarchaeota archaeon]|jgi:hypothetical protein